MNLIDKISGNNFSVGVKCQKNISVGIFICNQSFLANDTKIYLETHLVTLARIVVDFG